MTTQTAKLKDDSLERDAGRDGSVNEDEAGDLDKLSKDDKDATAFEMRQQVIGRRRLEYPAMQNDLEQPREDVHYSADANTCTSDVENVVECEEEKSEEL